MFGGVVTFHDDSLLGCGGGEETAVAEVVGAVVNQLMSSGQGLVLLSTFLLALSLSMSTTSTSTSTSTRSVSEESRTASITAVTTTGQRRSSRRRSQQVNPEDRRKTEFLKAFVSNQNNSMWGIAI